MEKPKISIIVPVYNTERSLRESLDSIKRQTFTDWECILVDDGSTDGSPVICDEYAAADSRFHVIHKANGGVSDSRNVGIRAAGADLVGFVDSDDWIEPGMFELLYRLITENDADIAQVGFIKEFEGRHSHKPLTDSFRVISGKEALHLIGYDRLPSYLWNKLHRREIMTCDFPVGRNFEDIYVYGQWLRNVRRMALDPTPMYHYRMRRGSVTHTDVAKNRYDNYLACLDRVRMIEDTMGDDPKHNRKNAYINKSAVYAAKIVARREKDASLRDNMILKISNEVKQFPLPSVRHMGLKAWWRARLLRNNPSLFRRIMQGVSFFDLDRKDRERRFYD